MPRALGDIDFGTDVDPTVPVTDPVVPRQAATVVVLDDRDGAVVTWLMQRHARMPFAPSKVVFPGGSVDPADRTAPDPLRAAAIRELAEEADLSVGVDDLHVWARWVTPAIERRRYDTWFFVAQLPAGQQPRDISGEADRADWMVLADALAAAETGALQMLPPTWSVLLELADHASVADIIAATGQRVVEPVCGRVVRTDDGYAWLYPGDEGF